ncbi:MAG: hypothetical protein ACYDDF_05555 [Thermoplasmatota archaeon]
MKAMVVAAALVAMGVLGIANVSATSSGTQACAVYYCVTAQASHWGTFDTFCGCWSTLHVDAYGTHTDSVSYVEGTIYNGFDHSYDGSCYGQSGRCSSQAYDETFSNAYPGYTWYATGTSRDGLSGLTIQVSDPDTDAAV